MMSVTVRGEELHRSKTDRRDSMSSRSDCLSFRFELIFLPSGEVTVTSTMVPSFREVLDTTWMKR